MWSKKTHGIYLWPPHAYMCISTPTTHIRTCIHTCTLGTKNSQIALRVFTIMSCVLFIAFLPVQSAHWQRDRHSCTTDRGFLVFWADLLPTPSLTDSALCLLLPILWMYLATVEFSGVWSRSRKPKEVQVQTLFLISSTGRALLPIREKDIDPDNIWGCLTPQNPGTKATLFVPPFYASEKTNIETSSQKLAVLELESWCLNLSSKPLGFLIKMSGKNLPSFLSFFFPYSSLIGDLRQTWDKSLVPQALKRCGSYAAVHASLPVGRAHVQSFWIYAHLFTHINSSYCFSNQLWIERYEKRNTAHRNLVAKLQYFWFCQADAFWFAWEVFECGFN